MAGSTEVIPARRMWRDRARSAALVVLWLYAWLTTELLLNVRLDLPPGTTTLARLLERRPTGNAWATRTIDGEPYLIARRPGFSGLLFFKSGATACVFDRDGRLVDWTNDDGDDPRFADPWYGQRDWPTFAPGPPPTWPPADEGGPTTTDVGRAIGGM